MRWAVVLLAVLLAGHVGATVWIAVSYRRSETDLTLLAVSALPLAQASLLAAWGAWGRCPSYVRATVVAIAVTALWAVECRLLNLEPSDDRSAAYALTFAVQTMLVGGLLATTRLVGWLVRRRNREEHKLRIQFSVGFLLAWVTAAALVLGAWRLAWTRSGWSAEAVQGRLFLFGGMVGVYNAVFAAIVLAAVFRGRGWYRLAVQAWVALTLICGVTFSQWVVLQAVFDTSGRVDIAEWLAQAGCQTVYLLITLVAVRLYYQPAEACVPGKDANDARRQVAAVVR